MTSKLGRLVESTTIQPHRGGSGDVMKGQTLRIIDVEGQQVADFVTIRQDDPTEFLDCVYTSWDLGRYKWKEGDVIRTNLMNPMWTIVSDKTANHYTGGGFCSRAARRLYLNNDERGCRDVIQDVYRDHGYDPNLLQSVSCFNIFMTVTYAPTGEWTIGPPITKPGDYIDLRAEMDVTWMVSVCAWPEVVNGPKPTPLRFEVYDPA
jgi:uncharacterized protein YcgI (DUF1989 family)